MADEMLRRNLDKAFDPGPSFPDRLLLSRTMAALQTDVDSRRVVRRRRFDSWRRPRMLALVAALLVVVIAATLAFGIRALHAPEPTPAKHGRVITRYHNGQLVLGNDNQLVQLGTLVAIDPVSGRRHTILDLHADVTLTDAAYSPDGTKLAYIRGYGAGFGEPTIWILNSATGQTKLLTTCHAPGCGTFSHLAWSPDGSRLAFSDGNGLGGVQLYLIDADGSHLAQLTDFRGSQVPTQPTWSPDGTSIAFSLSSGFGTPRSLEVINTDGTGLEVLLPNVKQDLGGQDLEPAWAPDGSRIAYVLFAPFYELWLMNPDGSHRIRIFSPGECCIQAWGGPAWSPDATRIAIVATAPPSTPAEGYGLWIVSPDGSVVSSFSGVGGDRPTWQPVP